jgi:hypothetical protein
MLAKRMSKKPFFILFSVLSFVVGFNELFTL